MNVFLTGAAGLLGGAIAQALIERGHRVIALTHHASQIVGNDGNEIATSAYTGSLPESGEIATIGGDITDPALGLEPALLDSIRREMDCVIHCAALVQFEAELEALRVVNVDGTIHVAANFPDARFVHVSTAYTCGLRSGPIAEALPNPDGAFANGYERSKALAETQLAQLRPDAIIVRPSIIVGNHGDGRIGSFDAIYRAFKLIAEGRIQTLPVASEATLNFVPIDHVVTGILAVAEKTAKQPRILHLAAHKAVFVEQFLKLMGGVPGLTIPRINIADNSPSALEGPAARALRPYWSYFTRCPDFSTEAFTQLTGKDSPKMDDAALMRQIDYCIAAGLIKPRSR